MARIPSNLEKILDEEPNYVVYVLKCKKPGYIYVGYTNDFYRRIKEHETGRGAEFTREYGVSKLLYLKPYDTKEDAMHGETIITLKCMLQLNSYNKVGGGKYPLVIKPLSMRREIVNVINTYLKNKKK